MKYLALLNATAATAMMILVVIGMIVVCFIGAPLLLLLVSGFHIISWLSGIASDSLRRYHGDV